MSTFSYYKGPITNLKPSRELTMAKAIEIIKGDEFKERIIKLRTTPNKDIAAVLKKNLDYFTFSGTFKKRAVSSLIKHSGLLCLDYDGLSNEDIEDLREKLPQIPEVHAFFKSPSGNGLKVIFKINVNNHEESFKQIPQYLTDNIDMPAIDASGSDVARACFVSWDTNAYFNPKSKTFKCVKTKAPKKAEAAPDAVANPVKATEDLPASERYERIKNLERVRYCVHQIEQRKIDITDNDYDDRRDVGFALSTLGEDARGLYHKAVQFNDAYDPKDADYKFSEALKNCNFKTPAKFFKLCKNHGILISKPRTIDQAKEEQELKEIIGDEHKADDYITFGLWEEGNIYKSLDLKNKPRIVSNFLMRILYHVETSDEEAYRMILIRNLFGVEKVIKINTDDFVSAGSFKKVIARKGNFIWLGQDQDLVRLQDKLQREERATSLVSTLGWNKRGSFYAFANGIFDTLENEFLDIDEYGIVEHVYNDHPQNYFIPAMSKIFADKDDLYTNDKKFKYVKSDTTFKQWCGMFCKVFGDNGKIGVLFYISAVFSDVIFRAIGHRFPLLFAYGQRGSGKGTMIQSMMRLFGEGQDSIGLGGASTVVGFMRKLAQFSNALVWLDEYKNSINPKHIESIKNIYDRVGYERGKKDNTFQTDSTPIRSAVIVSGQEMPTGEPALFMRTILLHFKETKRTEKARDLFKEFTELEEKGISHLTVMLLQYRKKFEKSFRETYNRVIRELVKDVNNADVDERFFVNYSTLISVCDLLHEEIAFPFTLAEIKKLCRDLLLDQARILAGSDDTARFWQIVEQLFNATPPMIQEGKHFQLKNGYIDIRVQDVYQLYSETLQRRKDPNILDKNTLDSYLMGDTKTFVKRHKPFFGGAQRWALQFRYLELGIDLIRADDSAELKSKYREMGLPTEELEAQIQAQEKEENQKLNNALQQVNGTGDTKQMDFFQPNGQPEPTLNGAPKQLDKDDIPF
uniref:VirE protein n=1 Tax=Sphingobacterium sp. (strain 21) TaxID=743722 RepID=F4C446_SPHS2